MGLIPSLPTNVTIVIIVMALVYTGVSVAVQRLLGNPKRLREIQAKVQVIQKEMNAMIKSKAAPEELMKKQKEIMPLMGEQMKYSMKPMIVIFPLLIIMYYVIIPHMPLFSQDLAASKSMFFIVVLIVGLITAGIIMVYDRKMIKQEMVYMKDQKVIETEEKYEQKYQNTSETPPQNNQ